MMRSVGIVDDHTLSDAVVRVDPLGHRLLAIWALFGMGVTQPILDLYGKNPEVFIAAGASRGQIVAFGLLTSFGPIAIAAFVLVSTRFVLGVRAASLSYQIVLGVAAFAAASALLRQLFAETDLTFMMALLVAVGVVMLDARIAPVRAWLSYLAILPVGALVLFLFFSESSELVWSAEASTDPSVSVGNPVPVVMLVLDELPLSSLVTPEGDVNSALFPNFARLAESSHWFQNAQSNSIDTAESVPIILSGTVIEDASPTSRDYPRTLFTMLGDVYAMNVQETITDLCPSDVCSTKGSAARATIEDDVDLWNLLLDASVVWAHRTQPPSVRDRLPSIDNQWSGFVGGSAPEGRTASGADLALPAEARPAWMVKMLTMADSLDERWPSSTLHYTHVLAPHVPWLTNPSGTMYEPPETQRSQLAGVEKRRWVDEPAWAVQGFQRHLFQLGLVDLLLGRVIDDLQRTGLWDEALIIVTADHGASFGPGDHRRWVTSTNGDAVYRVPLFVRTPGQEDGEVHANSAYSEDILPTIVDVLDVQMGPEWTLTGQSLLEPSLPITRPHHTGARAPLGGTIQGLFDAIELVRTLVPDQSTWQAVAAVGPHADLINSAMRSLDIHFDSQVVAEIDQDATYAELEPDTGIVPTVLTGRIILPPEVRDRHLLIAVNGVISGAGFAVAENDETLIFQALIPEAAYSAGPNQVSVLARSGDGTWIQASRGEVDQAVLRDATGDELNFIPAGERRLVIEATAIEQDRLTVRGWAADTKTKEPATEILVYFGEELVAHIAPDEQRPDLVDRFNSDRLYTSGFDITIPTSEIPDDAERLTVAAHFDDGALLTYVSLPSK